MVELAEVGDKEIGDRHSATTVMLYYFVYGVAGSSSDVGGARGLEDSNSILVYIFKLDVADSATSKVVDAYGLG